MDSKSSNIMRWLSRLVIAIVAVIVVLAIYYQIILSRLQIPIIYNPLASQYQILLRPPSFTIEAGSTIYFEHKIKDVYIYENRALSSYSIDVSNSNDIFSVSDNIIFGIGCPASVIDEDSMVAIQFTDSYTFNRPGKYRIYVKWILDDNTKLRSNDITIYVK